MQQQQQYAILNGFSLHISIRLKYLKDTLLSSNQLYFNLIAVQNSWFFFKILSTIYLHPLGRSVLKFGHFIFLFDQLILLGMGQKFTIRPKMIWIFKLRTIIPCIVSRNLQINKRFAKQFSSNFTIQIISFSFHSISLNFSKQKLMHLIALTAFAKQPGLFPFEKRKKNLEYLTYKFWGGACKQSAKRINRFIFSLWTAFKKYSNGQ